MPALAPRRIDRRPMLDALKVSTRLLLAFGGAVVALWLTRSLTRALGAEPRELAAHACRVANGDLAPREVMGLAAAVRHNADRALSLAVSALDTRARDGAALIAANGAAAQALDRLATQLLRAVAAFRLPGDAPPLGAILSPHPSEDHDSAIYPTGRRPLQPGRG